MAISASDFNPHLPCGRWRSGRIDRRCRDCTFQSTPSLRKVTTPLADICNCRRISIHTFLAEGDEDQYRICKRLRISIHTFLAEGDTLSRFSPLMSVAFQSTPSLRKVTENTGYVITSRVISIHTFLAEGDWRRWRRYGSAKDFNPHLPCGRWRCDRTAEPEPDSAFQSTPSLRKVTQRHQRSRRDSIFQSTPSLRKVTWRHIWVSAVLWHFNPHLPCGRWPILVIHSCSAVTISIHTFLAEGDACSIRTQVILRISIHTFLAEGDCKNIYN